MPRKRAGLARILASCVVIWSAAVLMGLICWLNDLALWIDPEAFDPPRRGDGW